MKRPIALLAFLALAGGTATVSADDSTAPARPLPDKLKPYDVDGDGRLSREEWKAFVEANKPDRPTNPWDTNGDGKLSPDEIQAAREAIRKEIEDRCLMRFDEADTDDDGLLSGEEFLATLPAEVTPERARNVFNRIDTDDDGSVSKEEFLKACLHGNSAPPRGPRNQKPTRPTPPTPPDPTTGGPGLPEILQKFDLNADGKLSRDEIQTAIENGTWPNRPREAEGAR
jgi:Ca2+-binding EF-hand superfamily protein